MSLVTILNACEAVNDGITGLKASFGYDEIPEALMTAQLPCIMVLPLSGEIGAQAAGLARISHRVRIWVIGQPLGQASAAARLAALAPFEASVRDAYLSAIKLNSLAGVSHATLDSYRYFVLEYGGVNYAALEFILTVVEKPTVNVEA